MRQLRHRSLLTSLAWIASAALAPAQSLDLALDHAKWIWSSADAAKSRPAGEKAIFTRELELAAAPTAASALASCDNHFELWVNGELAAHGDDWAHPTRIDLGKKLRVGKNTLEARCLNDGASPAGFLFAASLRGGDGATSELVSNSAWGNAKELGAYGLAPWGRLASPEPGVRIDVPEGYSVKMVAEEIGSVIALATGGKDRLFASTETTGLVELRDTNHDGQFETATRFAPTITVSQGMLFLDPTLYVTGIGPDGLGLYSVAAGEKAGAAGGPPELLAKFEGEFCEHGPHGIAVNGDGMFDDWLYVVTGNFAHLAGPVSENSPYKITYEGHLLPRFLDPRGHGTQCMAPGGSVVRIDRKTREAQIYAAGFRNSYDIAFDNFDELYLFDSDMEWDIGLPWYRPCRFIHVVAGGDYGWRNGSSSWPDWYEDSLPGEINAGRGSPTGMTASSDVFGVERDVTLFAGDWSLGEILEFSPDRGVEKATSRVLLRGHPLNVTDLVTSETRGGGLYFSFGGRGTQGGIGLLQRAPREDELPSGSLGSTHLNPIDPRQLPLGALMKELASSDRFTRFLATRALESHDPSEYEDAALKLASPLARAEALIALARTGFARRDADRSAPRLAAARQLLLDGAANDAKNRANAAAKDAAKDVVGETTRLAALRALELLLIDPDTAKSPPAPDWFAPLLPLFPCGESRADREFSQLLAFGHPAGAAAKLFAAFTAEPSKQQQMAYLYSLRCVKEGWPDDSRLEALRWLDHEMTTGSGGMSFEGYLRAIRDEIATGLTETEEAARDVELAAAKAAEAAAASAPVVAAEPRDFDRTFTFLERTLHAPCRSPLEGALVFRDLCSKCHQRGGIGAAVGPDLSTIAARFGARDLLDSILKPSRTISDQYRATNFVLKSGDIVTAIPILDDGKSLVLMDGASHRVELKPGDVASRRPAKVSLMPEGIVDPLTLEQIGDLVEFLLDDAGAVAATQAATAKAAANPSATAATLSNWRPLFDGTTLAGFSGDLAHWRVENGALVGEAGDLTKASALVATVPGSGSDPKADPKAAADYLLEFELKLGAPDQLSGCVFRGRLGADPATLIGPTARAGRDLWGFLDEPGGRGLLARVKQEIWWPLPDLNGWNHYLIGAVGSHLTVRLNGITTVDLVDSDSDKSVAAATTTRELLGFLLEPGAKNRVALRNLRIRSASPTR